ncbi:MAG: 6-phosphogluconolactonase [Solirubrobacterales bacterium]|nr:6-phosphogluconolactonase [Solirubrobacterales bacterium]
MTHELEVLPDAEAVAARGAELIAARVREVAAAQDSFSIAVSGGRTPWVMFGRLEDHELPWQQTQLFQADERVAPPGSPDRNLTHLIAALSIGAQGSLRPMPVNDDDLEAAAERYGEELPVQLDMVHLGLGPDGHTASLVPGDAVLEVSDRPVALTAGEYQGTRRMTLTYPAIDAAREILWIVTGEEKREPLAKLLAGDESIPAGRVRPTGTSLILADLEAAPN